MAMITGHSQDSAEIFTLIFAVKILTYSRLYHLRKSFYNFNSGVNYERRIGFPRQFD